MRGLPILFAIAACGTPGGGGDVVGPFTGPTHRFVVDRYDLPRDDVMAAAVADDLDGNGTADNHFGVITGLLSSTGDLSLDGADMVASGALASTVELVADDLTDDESVGVRYLGADGDDATVAGGTLIAGGFRSNRSATTRVPGRAVLRLPVYTNTDPVPLTLDGMELDLDPDGRGGYDAIVRGGLAQEAARQAAYAGLLQMFATEPRRHVVFARGVDTDRDGVLSTAELDASVIAYLVTGDVQLFVGDRYAPQASHATPDSVSIAVALHLTPCAAGRCTAAPPADLCRDRARDGDETDVDCGGGCQPCAAGLTCAAPADCQAGACDAGHCRAPTCADHLADGFESDTDCGGVCGPCQLGQGCVDDRDCAASHCDTTAGVCVAPPA